MRISIKIVPSRAVCLRGSFAGCSIVEEASESILASKPRSSSTRSRRAVAGAYDRVEEAPNADGAIELVVEAILSISSLMK
jgi:hypothetical protein